MNECKDGSGWMIRDKCASRKCASDGATRKAYTKVAHIILVTKWDSLHEACHDKMAARLH